ncbi:MarR family winged helix-turn-helix transcriptional regulator [Devosia sp. 2618]|uniref:MarR family winged helix-turn-helix transcriptional regulator n=1 Tax=Devosia sp. 2618 TaxID=3156454 RepID=UPI003395AE19
MQPANATAQLSTRSSLAALEATIELFRGLRVEMPIQVPLVFLIVAQHKGISAAELCKRTGLSQSSVSRNVSVLTKQGKAGEAGLGLIVKTIDPANTRAHAYHLTKDGRAMVGQLTALLARAVKVRKPVDVAAQLDAPMPASGAPIAFAGAHWEVWVD